MRHLPREFLGEAAVHHRDMDAGLLEDAAVQQADLAAATVGAGPGSDLEPSGRMGAVIDTALDLEGFEAGAEIAADLPKPVGGHPLLEVDIVGQRHVRLAKASVWRIASPKIRAAATATLMERKPGRMGMRTLRSALAATSAGTPALSRPSIRMSLSP